MNKMKDTGIVWCPTIPDNWHIDKVKNYFFISKEPAGEKNPTVLRLARSGVQVRDISTNEGQLAESYENYNPVQPGDLLLNPMDLYSGANCNVSNISGVISPAYVNLRSKTELNPKYFDYYFKVQYWTMAMFAHGKGVSYDNRWTINAEGVKNYEIPIPAIEEQNQIVKIIDEKMEKVDLLIANEEAQIEKLKEYKQSLITEVVTKGLDPDAQMKDSGNKWIGVFPAKWQIIHMGSLSKSMRNGYVGPTRDLFVDEGIRYIQSLHIKEGKIDFSKHEYYVTKEWGERHPRVSEGNLLIVQTGDIGQVGVVTKEYDGCNCHALIIVDVNNSIILTKYLSYYLQSKVGKELLLETKTGALLPHLNSGRIVTISVVVPSLNEQEKIVLYLDSKCEMIKKLISIKENKIESLNKYKKSLIYEYVTGKRETER